GAQAVSGPIQTTPTEYRQNPQRHSPTAGLCSTQFETRRYARHGDRAPQVKQKAIQGPFGHSGIVSPAGYHVRSEERRVGKECRSRRAREQCRAKQEEESGRTEV